MSEIIVTLYGYLYSASLFSVKFDNEDKQVTCMENLIGIYQRVHQSGMIVGPIDFNRIEIKLDDGSVRLPQRMNKEEFMNIVDLIKFAPPEINNGLQEWEVNSDLYCLAILLFVFRYSAFPFDGLLVNEKPIVNVDTAHKVYDKPVFIFDVLDTTNKVIPECNSGIINSWNNETNISLKDLFIRAFTDGINNRDIRVNCPQWLGALRNGGVMV